MPRVTLTFVRFTLIAAVGLTVIWTCPAAHAGATLTFAQGTTVCDQTSVTTACQDGSDGSPHLYKQLWKIGSDQTQHEWNYETMSGEGTPLLFANSNVPASGYSGSWTTWGTNVRNEPWQFQIVFHVIHMAPPHTDTVSTSWVTVTPKNTVVTSGVTGTEVLLHHAGGQHAISYGIVHKSVTGLAFTVTVTIYDMAGNVVKAMTLTQENGQPIGPGTHTAGWDGTRDAGGTDAPPGVYAYTVSAVHTGGPLCHDQDKVSDPWVCVGDDADFEHHYFMYHLDVPSLTADVCTPWYLHGAASGLTLTVYGPQFATKATVGLGDREGCTGYEDPSFQIGASEVGTFTAAFSAMQTTAAGAANRSGQPKPMRQGGNALEIWPGAYGGVGDHIGWCGSGEAEDTMAATVSCWNTPDDTGTRYAGSFGSGVSQSTNVRNSLSTCAIVHTRTHGNYDRVFFQDENWDPWYAIVAPSGAPIADIPAQGFYSLGNVGSLAHCLFVMYAGCHTAQTDSNAPNAARPLMDATLARGANCVGGWISCPCYLDRYLATFWARAMTTGTTISDADNAALADVMLYHPYDPAGTETFWCSNWNLKLRPARFGQ